ncbi:hypothetical protein CG51_00290 [Haematobacter missouriensis]|nr:hypothetical protein CG51_00290 [Haematobacter missouriensis]
MSSTPAPRSASARRRSRMTFRWCGSSPAVGSSATISPASCARAAASITRRAIPVESACGRSRATPAARPTPASAGTTARRRPARSAARPICRPAEASGSRCAVLCGNSVARPATRTLPRRTALAGRRSRMAWARMLLPAPEEPMTASTSPGERRKLTPVRQAFSTCRNSPL